MKVYIVGSGKLATELLENLSGAEVSKWGQSPPVNDVSIVVHAGSGRELDEVSEYCRATQSVLVELSTGSKVEHVQYDFPVLLCPNVNILMLKFMNMIAKSGQMFAEYDISLTESHQSEKKSVPGTAVFMANALGLEPRLITSIRDQHVQKELGVPEESLGRHAIHQITIKDEVCSIKLESRVVGASPYVSGVSKVISVLHEQKLQPRLYAINEFIELGWL